MNVASGVLAARCQLLADLNVAMLEQPPPAQDDAAPKNLFIRRSSVQMSRHTAVSERPRTGATI
ncbi:hypothetical protein KCP73_26360 [Salmonella enterica subsp. enterica]|nr:hypothetical protein KCP73_26360 [Salmonella enterica subsp. enterica]